MLIVGRVDGPGVCRLGSPVVAGLVGYWPSHCVNRVFSAGHVLSWGAFWASPRFISILHDVQGSNVPCHSLYPVLVFGWASQWDNSSAFSALVFPAFVRKHTIASVWFGSSMQHSILLYCMKAL